MNEFIDAIEDWDYDKVLEMLKNGADPNAVDDCGHPGLLLLIWVVCDDIEDEECMYEEAYKIAELLIQYGADPNMYIEEEKELLVDCIADCTYDNSEARDRFLYKLIDLLIENGANCKSYDADKRRKEIAEAKEWNETLVQALENEKASKGRNLDYDEILALEKTMYSNSP